MAYPRQLLDSAHALLHVAPETPATLQRAVSTAYYALFHLLIEEACGNWARQEQRVRLARSFDHKQVNNASGVAVRKFRNADSGSPEARLFSVASAFCQLQQSRLAADYDLSARLSDSDVAVEILTSEEAFDNWTAVRSEQIAHDYLFSLLFRER